VIGEMLSQIPLECIESILRLIGISQIRVVDLEDHDNIRIEQENNGDTPQEEIHPLPGGIHLLVNKIHLKGILPQVDEIHLLEEVRLIVGVIYLLIDEAHLLLDKIHLLPESFHHLEEVLHLPEVDHLLIGVTHLKLTSEICHLSDDLLMIHLHIQEIFCLHMRKIYLVSTHLNP
jgi:hypothetical protein